MSHFLIFVAVPEGKDLEAIMLPYHEYECTGIKQYLQFVPTDQEELLNDFEEYGEGKPMIEYAEDQGYHFDPDTQKWGRMTNPNKQWDWYEVGGRWNNYFGRNSGTKAQFKFDRVREQSLVKVLESYDQWHEFREEANPSEDDILSATNTLNDRWKDYDAAQKLYAGDARKFALDIIAFNMLDWFSWSVSDASAMHLTREEYSNQKSFKALAHAFIDLEGKWNEIGDMGWWGMCSNENSDNYDGENGAFWKWINSLPDETMLYVVDCHI